MFDHLTSWENLLSAFRKASRGKRGRPDVAAFEQRLEDNLVELRQDLCEHSYQPTRYNSFYIHEPKRRLISAAPFRDRVVHHALTNVMEPIFEASFLGDSYANRKGKGTHRALLQCQLLARRFPLVLQVDMRQFFPSIDHGILRRTITTKVDHCGILWLVDQVLNSGAGILREAYDMVYFPGDDLFAALRPRGLPIGNLTSQFWANVYLNPLDHFIRRELRCPGYVRYVDDLLLFGTSKPRLWGFKKALEERCCRLRLTIHPGSHPRPVTEGIPFLGFVTFPHMRRLKRRKGLHFRRRLKNLLAAWHGGTIPAEEVVASLGGWLNHVHLADSPGLEKSLLHQVPSEILKLL